MPTHNNWTKRSLLLALFLLIAVQGQGSLGQDDSTIEVKVGQEFIVTLDANHTTGYQWALAEPLNEKIVKLVSAVYSLPKTKHLGQGGTEIWAFKAVGKGQIIMKLNYARSWERGRPSKKMNYVVQVVD